MKSLLALASFLVLCTAVLAAGQHTKADKPLVIAQGLEVKLADFLVPGKLTIFDFTSEYCPPCRAYAEPLFRLHRARGDVAVVKVDINRPDRHRIDWDSPVAKEFSLHSIPHFMVFGPDGKLLADDADNQYSARHLVNRLIASVP